MSTQRSLQTCDYCGDPIDGTAEYADEYAAHPACADELRVAISAAKRFPITYTAEDLSHD